jgi:hypothetical protein
VLLQNGNTMLVVSPVGGNVERWQYATRNKVVDIFFPRGLAITGGKPRIAGGMHQCLPNFGMAPDAVAKYKLPQHGPLRGTPCSYFNLNAPNQNGQTFEGVGMRFLLPGNLEGFPWNIEISLWITALPRGLYCNTVLTPTALIPDNPMMPVCAGLHAFLNTPAGGTLDISGGQLHFGVMSPRLIWTGSFVNGIHLDCLGWVTMDMRGYQGVMAWSDSQEYNGLEPTMGDPKLFGTPDGIYQPSDKPLELSCAFEFWPDED